MKKTSLLVAGVLSGCLALGGCNFETATMEINVATSIERTIPKFEEAGQKWGKAFAEAKVKPGQMDSQLSKDFISALCSKTNLGYFYVHPELKDAFKKGFRVGYEDRTADLVLGPHIKEAAGMVGESTGNQMAAKIDKFDQEWEDLLRDGINVFIVLISEGSQADRKQFVDMFSIKYSDEYKKMSDRDHENNAKSGVQVTQGGTLYRIDPVLNAIKMPGPDLITNKFYSQAFSVMGDEWGRRYGSNLVKREELIDILRRSKPALDEGEGPEKNLRYVYTSFAASYRADADDTFKGIMKEAGITEKRIQSVLRGQ